MTKRLLAAFAFAIVSRPSTAQTIRGTVIDSVSGKGVGRARVAVNGTALQTAADSLGRFTIAGISIGEHLLAIHTPSLDSVSAGYSAAVTVASGSTSVTIRVPSALQIAATACGDRGYGNGGIVLGRLRVADDSTAPLAGTISAEWKNPSGTDTSKWASAMSDARGRFALCGVPLDAALSLRGVTDGASGQVSNVRVSSAARFGRAELVLRRVETTMGTFAGMVTDSTNKPITGVEVLLPDLGKGTATNEQGAFVLRDIPVGSQRVLARHVGYGPVESQLTFAGGQTIQRHITMTRSTRLDSVVVTEKAVDHALDDFEANRKLGLGHFITRAELAKQEGRSTAAVLTSLPGVKVFARGQYGWVGSGRHNATSFGQQALGLDDTDISKGAPLWDCYALVYVDDHIVWRGQKYRATDDMKRHSSNVLYVWEPLFDINSIPVAEIEAIEYYASAAETPSKYATLNSQCGVLVIHTVRFHKPDSSSTRGAHW